MIISNGDDITKSLLIGQLIKDTEDGQLLWERTDFINYDQYFFRKEINQSKILNFRVYHRKNTSSGNMMNIYMSYNEGKKYITLFSIDGELIDKLIDCILKTNGFYYYELV